jgi:hypothetical protein
LGGISRLPVLVLAALVVSACQSAKPSVGVTMTGRCATRVHAKGSAPKLPANPPLTAGSGAVVGTLADDGGALPHYQILASTPGDAPNAPHATATADSLGGFVFAALTPGRYRLFVRAYAHRPDSTDIDVEAARVDTVHLSPAFFDCVR